MSDTKNKFYLTTPIYYVNARPHIGHAYSTIAADVIARRHRLLGDDTFFLTGTDEHGQKVQRSAEKAGIPPQQFTDEVSATFRNLWKRMGITNDDYIRTTEERHKRGVQKLWTDLEARGAIYLSTYTGQYSVGEEMFIDGPPGTIGPDGKPTETVTEENYFFKLSDYQERLLNLIESGELHIQPESVRNEVLSFVRGNPATTSGSGAPSSPGFIGQGGVSSEARPSSAEASQFPFSAAGTPYVPGALKDLSISRTTFDWGIPVPGNPKHVIYVWLDALANYMTAIGYGSDDPAEQAKFAKYWPADIHLVGKEITRFHCVYWPAFLMAAGLPTPKSVVANGWLLFEESKMSKSRGNIVRTETILDAFGALCPAPTSLKGTGFSPSVDATPSDAALAAEGMPTQPTEAAINSTSNPVLLKGTASAAEVRTPSKHEQDLFASDVIRYFLLREIPFGQDGSFSFDALVTRYNADLANGYGNLVSRTLNLILQNQEGTIVEALQEDGLWLCPSKVQRSENKTTVELLGTQVIIDNIQQLADGLSHPIKELAAINIANDEREGIGLASIVMRNVGWVDAYLTANAPWKLAKSDDPLDRRRMDEVLYTAAESIRIITALLYPVIPYATAQVWSQLGLGDIEAAAKNGELKNLQWGGLKPGTKLGPLSPIFPRADKGIIEIMNTMEQKPAGLPHVNNSIDNPAQERTEFGESPIASISATPSLNPLAETIHPITAHATPETPQIVIDDFVKIDLRVAQIIVAERIPKADKLLRLEVDLGYEKRQILSGIAEWYTPEELIGRKIVVIANLAPRKMRGLESHGMLLAASHGENGKPVLATFGEDIALGSRLR